MKKIIVGGNLASNPSQVLSYSELAARGAGLIFKVLLNPTSGRDASHPCLISTWPKEGYTVVCVGGSKGRPCPSQSRQYLIGERFIPPTLSIVQFHYLPSIFDELLFDFWD